MSRHSKSVQRFERRTSWIRSRCVINYTATLYFQFIFTVNFVENSLKGTHHFWESYFKRRSIGCAHFLMLFEPPIALIMSVSPLLTPSHYLTDFFHDNIWYSYSKCCQAILILVYFLTYNLRALQHTSPALEMWHFCYATINMSKIRPI